MNLIALDIETNSDPAQWDRKERMGITCAVAYGRITTERGDQVNMTKSWVAGMSNPNNPIVTGVTPLVGAISDGEYQVADEMSEGEVELMLEELLALLRPDGSIPLQARGRWPVLVGWNTVGFDFPAIASNIPHRRDDVVEMMMESIDPCFQFARTLGWPIGLDAIAQDMLGEGKPEGMDGSVAATAWPERAAEVLSYCYQDCILTLNIMDAIRAERQVRWTSKSGNRSAKPASQFKVGGGWGLVKKVAELNEPDRSWMKDYEGQFELESYLSWTKDGS